MKKIIGLTGTTGSGKSTVSEFFKEYGFFIINCDKIAKDVVESDREILSKLSDAFGKDILEGGVLNRKLLAFRAFKDASSTELLNNITLPYIIKKIKELISGCKSTYILLDAPTLFESGADSMCSMTVGVVCDPKTRIERIISRDNITEQQALSRVSAQKSDDFFRNNCTYIIENNSNLDQLKAQTQAIIDFIVKE